MDDKENKEDKERSVDEGDIIAEFKKIAFYGEKDSERMRALEWLADYLEKKNGSETVLRKLDEVLAELRR